MHKNEPPDWPKLHVFQRALSHQMYNTVLKKAVKSRIWSKYKACELWSNSVTRQVNSKSLNQDSTIVQKIFKNTKIQKFKWDILDNFQTMSVINSISVEHFLATLWRESFSKKSCETESTDLWKAFYRSEFEGWCLASGYSICYPSFTGNYSGFFAHAKHHYPQCLISFFRKPLFCMECAGYERAL